MRDMIEGINIEGLVDRHKAENDVEAIKSRYREFGIEPKTYKGKPHSRILNMVTKNGASFEKYLMNTDEEIPIGEYEDDSLNIHQTGLWIVTGKNRIKVANHLCRDIILHDVIKTINPFHKNAYMRKRWVELFDANFGKTLPSIANPWLLYLNDADNRSMDVNVAMTIQNVIMARIDEALHNDNGLPTVITVRDGAEFMNNVVENYTFNNAIKVLGT